MVGALVLLTRRTFQTSFLTCLGVGKEAAKVRIKNSTLAVPTSDISLRSTSWKRLLARNEA